MKYVSTPRAVPSNILLPWFRLREGERIRWQLVTYGCDDGDGKEQ